MYREIPLVCQANSWLRLGCFTNNIEYFDIATKEMIEGYPAMPEGIKIAFFCEYLQEIDLKGSKTIPVIVEIKHLYLDDQIITDREKMKVAFEAVARTGRGYASLKEDLVPPTIP